MIAVSNASPLIALSRVGLLDSLPSLFDEVFISPEVHREVVIDGVGKPGATAVAAARWIEIRSLADPSALPAALMSTGLGAGEASAVLLARQLRADIVLMDERKGRRWAFDSGIAVMGTVGIIEALFRRGQLDDLGSVYRDLLRQGVRIDIRTLQASLRFFGIPGL